MTDETPSPVEEEIAAIKRIAATPDGALLNRHLRRVLETVIDMPSDGALSSHNGRRTLARDLMTLMREGIEINGRSDSSPILGSERQPTDVRRRRSISDDRRDRRGIFAVDANPGDGSDAA